MGYVGNSPAEKYTTIDKQVITGNGTVGPYTLTHSVGNEQEIEVFVNNVRQEPGIAYTVSANQLTMGGTVAAADDFYIVFQGKAKMTATHPPTFDLNAANGTFTGDLTVDTNTLYVDSTNNRVGIGTVPSVNFHVKNASGNLEIRFDSDNARNIVFADNNGTYDAQIEAQANGTLYIATRQAQPMLFAINNSEKMRIDSSGNVNLTGLSNGTLNFAGGNTANGSKIQAFNNAGNGNGYLAIEGYDYEYMRIDSSGNVGIGTNSPAAPLSVYNASNPYAKFSDAANFLNVGVVTSNYGLINSSLPISFQISDTEHMRIDSTGNLLVGQSTTALPGLGNTTAGISLAGQYDIIAASRTSGAALLLNRNTDDGDLIQFSRDGTTVGEIGVSGGNNIYISGQVAAHSGLTFATNQILPTAQGSITDGAESLGSSSNRFSDLYLSGGVYLGGTGSANLLHYYEEGAWTPALNGGLTPTIYQASFTVIGNRVFLTCNITVPTNSINAAIIVSGLPYSTLHDGSGALSYTNAQTTNDFFILVQGSQIYFYKGIGTTNYLLSDLSGYILRFTAQYNINN